jgi:hypothetical protein
VSRVRISGGRIPGRRHVQSGTPCQDAYAVLDQPERSRAAAAVADGLGSEPLSGTGSQVAADAALASLAKEAAWDLGALGRAFAAAHAALVDAAATLGFGVSALATTLQVAALDGGMVRAMMVGDGAVILSRAAPAGALHLEVPALLLAPPDGGYANEVVPLTSASWQQHLRQAEGEGDAALVFSDGLTRLLLAKGKAGWSPYAPFFDAFLPHLRAPSFDAHLVQGFLARPEVDRSWDDDKCLVVLAHEPG